MNEAEADQQSGRALHPRAEGSKSRNEIRGYEERELEVIAFVLMAARFYLYLRFSKSGTKAKQIPDRVITAYMKRVTRGLKG